MPLVTKRNRAAYSSLALGALFVVAAASQAKLQVLERGSTMDLAKGTKKFTLARQDHAKRGTIYSADMKPLAQDSQAYELNIRFDKLPKSDAFFLELASATGIPATEFAALAHAGTRTKTWVDPISGDRYKAVQELRSKWRADGVSMTPADKRVYPLGEAAACLVGIIRDQSVPNKETGKLERATVRTGLESSKNELLLGEDGMRVGLTDKSGAFLPMRMEDSGKSRIDGRNLVLTIDSNLQDQATQAIKKAVKKNKADNGTAIVLDPKTGDVLAMANWPSFDPNGADTGQFGFNLSYMAQLEPGSTFKILTLAKAIDSGKTTIRSITHCSGVLHPTSKTRIRCDAHGGKRAHGSIDAVKAIAKSCNVAAASWSLKIGRTEFISYLEELGLLDKTGLGVPGEVGGLFRRDEYAQILQLAHVGFGQSITCTPIGLASAFSMLANGGVRMKPRLVNKIGAHDVEMEEGKQIVSAEAAARVLTSMEAVIESEGGTGYKLRIPGYRLGGKTGTAEKIGFKTKAYVSNFIGFVPADKPQAVILVMVNNPKGGDYYGGTVAGPAFVEVTKAVIRHFNIPPDRLSK